MHVSTCHDLRALHGPSAPHHGAFRRCQPARYSRQLQCSQQACSSTSSEAHNMQQALTAPAQHAPSFWTIPRRPVQPQAIMSNPQTSCSTPRRQVLTAIAGLSVALSPLQHPQPVQSAIIEEDVSMRVYLSSVKSVVSVITSRLNKANTLEQQGVGSGFVWATDEDTSWVVTNYHVISKLDKSTDVIRVSVPSLDPASAPSVYPAILVATDTMTDLAVLQVTDANLTPLKLGTSKDLQIGQSVFAVGAPYGLSSSMSAGVVSGLNRSIPSPVGTRIYGAIQTDASINAGNSGGPLLDSAGRVVGVNTATFTRSGTGRGSGVNFALPIDTVRDVVPKLIVFGNARGRRV